MIPNRYREIGLLGLCDQGPAPYRQVSWLPFWLEKTFLGIYKELAAGAPARSVTGTSGNTLSSSRAYYADHKSEFMLSNREYCYPVTVNDYPSGYLLTRESVPFTTPTSPSAFST